MMPHYQMIHQIHPRDQEYPPLSFEPIFARITSGQLHLPLPDPVQNALLHFPLSRLRAEYTCNNVEGFFSVVHEERNLVVVELRSPSVHFAVELYYEHQGNRFALWSTGWQNPIVTVEVRAFNKRHGQIDPMVYIVLEEHRKRYRQHTLAHANFISSAWPRVSMAEPPVYRAIDAMLNHLEQLILHQILIPNLALPDVEEENIEPPQKARMRI